MTSFTERFSKLLEERDSILCIGLDPAIPKQRNRNVIPPRYLDDNATKTRLNFCLEILDQTAEYAIAAKPNEQYIFGFSLEQHRELTKNIRNKGLLSILDCKLGDIGSSSESKLFWVYEAGYDAITVFTQQGNLGGIVRSAHNYEPEIGILALTLMSNPEAVKYFKQSTLNGKPVYLPVAEEIRETGADGPIVGATGHVTEHEIAAIRKAVGEDRVMLVPGVGAQEGNDEKVIGPGGRNLIINVSRGIIYDENPGKKAEEYKGRFNKLRLSNF